MLDITIYSPRLFKINQMNNSTLIRDAIAYKLHYKCSEVYSMSDINVDISPTINTNDNNVVDLAVSSARVKITERGKKRITLLLRAEIYDAIDGIINKTFQRHDAREATK